MSNPYADRGVRQDMAMQSGIIAPASSHARAYALGGSKGGEARRSDSLTLTPAPLLPYSVDGETGAVAPLFGCRRGPPQRPPNNCHQLLPLR